MPKLSPYKVERKFMKYYVDNLINAFNLCLDRPELEKLMKDILTDSEIRMLAKRLQIGVMLYAGHDYRTITAQLKVTNQTVARVSKLLDYGEGGFYKVVKEIYEVDQKARKKMEKGPELPAGPHKLGTLAAKFLLEQSARELLKTKRKSEAKKNIKLGVRESEEGVAEGQASSGK